MRVGVILAAGGGRRMGKPKALMELPGGKILLQAHVEALRKECRKVVVALGAVVGAHLLAQGTLRLRRNSVPGPQIRTP